jgi:PTS system nitrogen regulatory IIA component
VEDLDIAQLAAYLHLTPDQVTKMAVRGRIPARKVGNLWRFSEAEIHHWLEDRIGASDPEELEKVQAVLNRAKGDEIKDLLITEMCVPETIQVPLNARTRGSVIRSICSLAAETGMMWDAPSMAEAVSAREQMHPTALDCGVALLHPRRPQTSILADSVIALGVCPAPIPFSDRGHLTDVFFLICSYDDTVHLRILAKLSRMISSGDLLDQLRSSETSGQAWAALRDAEEHIDDADEDKADV